MNLRTRMLAIAMAIPLLAVSQIAVAQKKPKDEGWSALLPSGEGRAQVLEFCSDCHNLRSTVHERKTRAGWTKTVSDMIGRGAHLFPEEIEPVTAYLARSFGPDVPKPLNVNTASKEDLEKLPSVTSDVSSHILEVRAKAGPFKSADELSAALGKPAGFEKYRYFLKYKD